MPPCHAEEEEEGALRRTEEVEGYWAATAEGWSSGGRARRAEVQRMGGTVGRRWRLRSGREEEGCSIWMG